MYDKSLITREYERSRWTPNDQELDTALEMMLNTSPQSIKLISCQFQPSQFLKLTKKLFNQKQLFSLICIDCKLGDREAEYIADLLKKNVSIKELYLPNNQIGDDGIIEIAVAIEQNPTVQHLTLNCNQIGNAGATALAKTLSLNPSSAIDSLVLLPNGAKIIIDMFSHHCNSNG